MLERLMAFIKEVKLLPAMLGPHNEIETIAEEVISKEIGTTIDISEIVADLKK